MNELGIKLPELKLLLFKDSKEYVAHILDFDLVGTGATREEALKEVFDSATAQLAYALEHGNVNALFHDAPQECYEKWKKAEPHHMRYIPKPTVNPFDELRTCGIGKYFENETVEEFMKRVRGE